MAYELGVVMLGSTLAAIVSGGSGFAFALIASAVWLHVMAPAQVVPLAIACSIMVNLAMAWQLRGTIKFDLLWPFLAGAMVGVSIGVAALHALDAHLVRQGVGALLIAYSLYMFLRPEMPVVSLSPASGKIADGMVGMLGGFMGGATSLNGIFPHALVRIARLDESGAERGFPDLYSRGACGQPGVAGKRGRIHGGYGGRLSDMPAGAVPRQLDRPSLV